VGVDAGDRGELSGAALPAAAPAFASRFAHWPRGQALVMLLTVLAILGIAAWVPLTVGRGEVATAPALTLGASHAKARPRDDDLQLYDRAIARIRHGENYYSFIVAEHRRSAYPVNPAMAVRLPTLAYLGAAMGIDGEAPAPLASAVAVLLMIGVLAAWWGRLGGELGTGAAAQRLRRMAVALLFVGASLGLNRYYFVLHELWAGMLLALAMGLHRPDAQGPGGKWLGAWCAAALALAIREHALPFVALMTAFAGYRRAWREVAAWGLLIAVFLGLYALHLHLISAQVVAGDRHGPSWMALRGLGGWLANVVLSSNLRFLPHWLAGPLVMLGVLGFAGWRSRAGAFATLLYLGYGLLFMVIGRDDNFYWGAIVAPAMFVGLAFAPSALAGLVRAALPGAAQPAKSVA
jgi:hypothetical protein